MHIAGLQKLNKVIFNTYVININNNKNENLNNKFVDISSFRMTSDEEEVATSALRWPIMFVFAVYSLSSAFQWIQFAIIPSIFQTYYGVSAGAITWTSTIYMASFIPLVFPATWLIDNTGMKNVALLGSGINAIGTLVKCFAIHPDYFWLAFIGQTISACAQCLILELPPKIAAIWFPTSEIATATRFLTPN